MSVVATNGKGGNERNVLFFEHVRKRLVECLEPEKPMKADPANKHRDLWTTGSRRERSIFC